MPALIWDPQFKYFAEHFHVVALDPRSQGDSDKPTEGNSCERRAQDIKELLEHLKLDHVVLVGWSLGVPELLTYAEQFGGSRVRGYVLVDGFAWDKQDPNSSLPWWECTNRSRPTAATSPRSSCAACTRRPSPRSTSSAWWWLPSRCPRTAPSRPASAPSAAQTGGLPWPKSTGPFW